ncbi:MAG: neutral zinc metallopeptidase [Myxococcota bacterium]
MRWDRGHTSDDVVDARGRRPASAGMGAGSLLYLFQFASRFGWKGILLAAVVVGGIFLFSNFQMGAVGPVQESAGEQQEMQFVSFVIDDVQGTWDRLMPGYRHSKLVVFRGATNTGCGYGDSATGPFYCPQDQQVYLDLSFFDELSQRFGAPGDFAQAYVVAHEIGHHVQDLMGTTDRVRQGRAGVGAGGDSVRVELQADCYAGVWASQAAKRDVLEVGDLEEGLRAAAAIGDDRLQKQSGGRVAPDSFTHGTSEQRVRWLRRGYEAGDPAACDTFSARQL